MVIVDDAESDLQPSARTCRTAARSRARAVGALYGDDFLLELDGFGALFDALVQCGVPR
jgi:hypothetical protein